MKYKRLNFVEKFMTAVDLNSSVPRHTGAKVMPVLVTPEGEWLQDSRDIINELEKRFPPASDAESIFPSTPKRRFASQLLEAWGDEFWIPIAMHYRWNYPESVAFFRKEALASLIPPSVAWMVPSFVQSRVADEVCKVLIGFLPRVGVRPGQTAQLEQWTEELLGLLDAHFAEHRHLLGGPHPTIADFGLAGPLVNHLTRDPAPLRLLFGVDPVVAADGGPRTTAEHITRHKHVYRWAQRMQVPQDAAAPVPEELRLMMQDELPGTLRAVLLHVFTEFVPQLEDTAALVTKLQGNKKFSGNGLAPGGNSVLPRVVGEITVPLLLGNSTQYSFSRGAIPFNLWKMQGVLEDMKGSLEVTENRQVLEQWLDSFGVKKDTDAKTDTADALSTRVLRMNIPPLKRENVRVKLVY
jgi:glutathione S-transferase